MRAPRVLAILLVLSAFLWAQLAGPSAAGPITPEDAMEGPPAPTLPAGPAFLAVQVQNPGKRRTRPMRVVLSDGLDPSEAAVLAAVLNPIARRCREALGLGLPALVEWGVLPVPVLEKQEVEETAEGAWLSREDRLLLAGQAARARRTAPAAEVDLEAAWYEWQSMEAARLFLYRRANARETIRTLREIQRLYRDIYKATSRGPYAGRYSREHSVARRGYEKMKGSIREAEKDLSAARVGLAHAMGLPTHLEVPVQNGVEFTPPRTLPDLKGLKDGADRGRMDLMALQDGIMKKDPALMGYIYSRFEGMGVLVMGRKKEEWLDARRPAVLLDFPLLRKKTIGPPLEATNGRALFKEYKRRLGALRALLPRLYEGAGYLMDEISKIEVTMPSLAREAEKAAGGPDPVRALERKKTLYAVRLLRLRLMRKLMDTLLAMEISSGRVIVPDIPPPFRGTKVPPPV